MAPAFQTAKKPVRPRESGDPGRQIKELEILALDPRFRGDERSVWFAP